MVEKIPKSWSRSMENGTLDDTIDHLTVRALCFLEGLIDEPERTSDRFVADVCLRFLDIVFNRKTKGKKTSSPNPVFDTKRVMALLNPETKFVATQQELTL